MPALRRGEALMPKSERPSSREDDNTHHLLCKKVAQLTKVIYLLNTRNEDAEGRLQELQQRFQQELEAVETDAQAKLEALKKANSPADAAAEMTRQLDALAAKYEAEKVAAIGQFEEWKKQLAARSEDRDTRAREAACAAAEARAAVWMAREAG